MPFIGRELPMVSPALKCHATPLPLNVAQHAAAPAETGSHDASSWKLSIRSEACIQSGVSHDRKMISDFIFRSKSVPLSFLKCPIETSSSLSACHCVSCFFLLADDLLSPGEAGQEYPLPYQQRGPGQVSDYQSGGAHQPDRGETTDTWRKHLSCWSKSKAVQHTLHKSSVNWLAA